MLAGGNPWPGLLMTVLIIVDTLNQLVLLLSIFGEDQSDKEAKLTMFVQCLMSFPVHCVL